MGREIRIEHVESNTETGSLRVGRGYHRCGVARVGRELGVGRDLSMGKD